MSERVVGIVQARMGSVRLPGKVLRRFGKYTALEHHLRRLADVGTISEIVVATTERDEDTAIVDLCDRLHVRVVRGSSEDVLERFRFAAELADADIVVRLTADCPLLDPFVVERIIRASGPYDYTSNTIHRSFPIGLDAEVFARSNLEAAAREAADCYEREHVTPFLYRNPSRFACFSVERSGRSLETWRWTLDEPRDAAFFDAVFAQVGERLETDFAHDWLVDFLDRNPSIAALNAAAGYRNAQQRSASQSER